MEHPDDWKQFLTNDVNKRQFIKLLVREWGKDDYADRLKYRKVIAICEGEATLLTSQDGISTSKSMVAHLKSSQEESDARFALYCKYASRQGYKFCRVKSPDTDVFFILLHHDEVGTQ